MRTVRVPQLFRSAFLRALLLLGIVAPVATGARAAADLSAGDTTEAAYAVTAAHGDSSLKAAFEAESPVSDLRVGFLNEGVRFGSKAGAGWQLDVTLDGAVMLSAAGNRVDYSLSSTISGSFQNTPRGVAQVFEIAAPSTSPGPMALTLSLAGTVTPRLDHKLLHTVEFQSKGKTVLRLGEVDAIDASGNEVPVSLVLEGGVLRIVLDRPATSYPVTVRGIFASPKNWRTRPAFDASSPETPQTPMAPPANDTCAGAVVIPPGGAFPHTTATVSLAEATTLGDPADPSCAFLGAPLTKSIWYTFTPSASGTYSFTTCADAPTATTVDDPVMAIYTSTGGCGGSFSELPGACDDDSCVVEEFQSFISTPLIAGTTYYLVVWNEGPAPQVGFTNVQLVVSASFAPNPPANDQCAGAVVIPPAGPFPHMTATIANVTDAGTAGDPPAPSCAPGGTQTSRSVWYSFTPSATGLYTLSSCSDGGATATTVDDTILAVYTSAAGCAGAFTELSTVGSSDGCDDDGCPTTLQSSLTTSLISGTQYWILLSQLGTELLPPGHTAMQLRVTTSTAPANEICTAATGLTLDAPLAGTTVNGVDDYRSPSTAGCYSGVGNTPTAAVGRDVVYAFTPPITASYSFRVTGFDATAGKNLALYLASDCPTGGTPPLTVTCLKGANRNPSFSAEEANCVSLTAATPVYAYVDEATSTPGSAFTIEVNRCFVETEPNDTPGIASAKSCGTEGAISSVGEADFFTLGALPAGTRMFAMADGVAGGTSDFDLRITTDLDTIEFDDLNADTQFGALAPVLAGSPLTAATSYLRVSINAASPIQTSEPYRLYSVKQPAIASATAEAEPNGTIAQANTSPAGYYSGTLSGAAPSTDVDIFAFNATVGDLIFVALDEDPTRDETPVNGALALLDSAGVTLVAVNDGAATSSSESGVGSLTKPAPFSPAEGLTWRARYTGQYYARVAIGTISTGSTGAGNYLLSAAVNCLPTDDPDGDGVPSATDCAPNDPGVSAIPGEVAGATFATKTQMTWNAASGGSATIYDAVRGDRTGLPVGPGGGDETCFPNQPTTSVTDSTVPPSGGVFWYAVRGRNSCGVGSYGRQGLHGVPGTVRTTTTCP